MSLPTALRWTLPPLALLALAGWLASPQLAQGQPAGKKINFFSAGEQEQGGAGAVPARGPAAFPPNAAGPDRLSAVQQQVAENNAGSGRQQQEFVRAGWQLVEVPPPDASLAALDPALLGAREAELRQQMATTVAAPDRAANLSRIAREAREEPTQVAAVEALGRIASDAAQDQLVELLHALPDGALARREVAPLLHPRDLADPRAAQLARLLDAADLNGVEKKQIAFTLALVSLRDRSTLAPSVLAALSPDARALLASTTSLAQLRPGGSP